MAERSIAALRRVDPANHPRTWLMLMTALSLAINIALYLRSFWLSDAYPGPFADVPWLLGGDYTGLAKWVGGITALFVLWGVSLRAAWALPTRGRSLALILAFGAALMASLLYTYPVTNSDVFHYTADARVLWQEGANPLVTPPDLFNYPDLRDNMWWWWQPSPYGPLWALLTGIPYAIGGGGVIRTLVAFKAMAAIFWLATVALVYFTVAARSPRHAPLAAAVLALNPLAVMLIAIGAQNDAAMMFFVAMGFFLLSRDRHTLALPAFVAGALIKASAAIFLPIVVVYSLRRAGPRQTALGLILATIFAAATYAPFWEGTATFDVLRDQGGLFTTSPSALLALGLEQFSSRTAAERIVQGLGSGLLLTVALLVLRRRRTWREPATPTATLLLAYLFLATFWFQPWYLPWLLVPAALSLNTRLIVTAGLFTWSAMMLYVVTNFGWYLWWSDPVQGERLVQILGPLVTHLPVALAILVPPFALRVVPSLRDRASAGTAIPQAPADGGR